MKFKDYKEKQKYYRERAKQEKVFFISSEPLNPKHKRVGLKKGITYVKPKGDDK